MAVAPTNPAAMTRARTDRALVTATAAIRGLEAARALSQSDGAEHGQRWRCHFCGEDFTAYAPAERHVDEQHGGARLECVAEPSERPSSWLCSACRHCFGSRREAIEHLAAHPGVGELRRLAVG
jgi:hypothetical protein